MSGELNTARALLKAENFDGARRIVRKALETNSSDLNAWGLRVEIEMEAGQPKEALSLVRQVLSDHPDSRALRSAEFDALIRLGKKREAKEARARFKEDFPYMTHRIEQMDLQLDASAGKTRKVSAKLREYADYGLGPEATKDLGIAHHRIDDLWTARRMMEEAHPHFPNDAELNAAMASNWFQLARPGKARKYARLALALDPSNRRMAFLIKMSWAMYFPPFYLLSVILLIFFAMDTLFGRIPAYILTFVPLFFLLDLNRLWYSMMIVVTGVEIGWLSTPMIILWAVIYYLATNPGFYKKLFQRRKAVALKKY